jgi:threonine/homoserine/homoserine lactone efflux protein
MDNLNVLPLAITMMAGPAIMAAIVFVTNPNALRVSLPYLAGVAIATAVGVVVARGLASLLGDGATLGAASERGSAGTIIQLALVVLLIGASVRIYLRRETAEPPRWLGSLLQADPRKALLAGVLVILLGPSDVVVMLTVGTNLEHNHASLINAAPFIAATVLIAALPLLAYLTFRSRAERAMPKVRDWMNTNSWLVNILVCCIFIALILS